MANIRVNNVTIEYETFGETYCPTLLLIAGMARGMTMWHKDFCIKLANHGLRVIRFDNRDTGHSTKFDNTHLPDIPILFNAFENDTPITPPYSLDDMAHDAISLLNALNIDSAHIAGISLGGMIAQLIAVNYPQYVQSLTLIMSSTQRLSATQPKSDTQQAFTDTPPDLRDDYIKSAIDKARMLASPNAPFNSVYAASRVTREYNRCHNPGSRSRHFAAMLASNYSHEKLAHINAPTIVIHGEDDPLLPPEHALKLVEAIPDAMLSIVPKMGHELPPRLWPDIINQIINHLSVAVCQNKN